MSMIRKVAESYFAASRGMRKRLVLAQSRPDRGSTVRPCGAFANTRTSHNPGRGQIQRGRVEALSEVEKPLFSR